MAVHLEQVDLHLELPNVVAVGEYAFRRASAINPDFDILTSGAAKATEAEHSMTLREGLRTYPRAVGWSILISTAIVMEGFDTILMTNLYAYGPFQKRFGVQQPNGTYQLTAAWQSGLSNAPLVGEILGLFINGIIAERFGYRKTIIASLMLVVAFIFIVFFAQNIVTLLVGEILLGIPWGVFQTITTAYASEVCPVALRAYLTTYVNLCWVVGQLLASGVLRAMVNRSDSWGYRIPFALQWLWPVPIAVGVAAAPESPWWLMRKGRRAEARKALARLSATRAAYPLDDAVALMAHTDALEAAVAAGTSYADCFSRKGGARRRTEIVCGVWAVQTLCGAALMGYSTYFYEQAGLAASAAFTLSMGQFALGAVGTLASWFLMLVFGRRSLYLAGQVAMCVLLVAIGCLGLVSRHDKAAQWAIGSLLLVYTFAYDATVGPVCYSLVAELSSSRLRAKSIVLARVLFNIMGVVVNVITPHMLNPSAWNWGAKSGFFWAGTCFLCVVWSFFRLPEPKGRTYAELDVMFEQGVPTRQFKDAIVDPFMPTDIRTASIVALDKKALDPGTENFDKGPGLLCSESEKKVL